ncbi:MAG: AAA family ATPase [Desulfobulbaceae bacterium]|nr:AAA family ATPase [Desulfobulbaceae bacterium]
MELEFNDVVEQEQIDFGMMSSSDFIKQDIPIQRNILSTWLKEGSINMVSSNPGSLKTWYVMGICKSILTGENFGKWDVEKEDINILFIDGELHQSNLKTRLVQMNLKENGDRFHILCKSMVDDKVRGEFDLTYKSFRDYVKNTCIEMDIGLVIFDNMSSLCIGLDDNVKHNWDLISQYFLELRHKNISSIIVEHNNRNSSYRGSSSKLDNLDTHTVIKRQSMDKNVINISFGKYRYELDKSVMGTHKFVMSMTDNVMEWKELDSDSFGRNKKVLTLLGEGLKQDEIGKLIEVDRSYVSKIKSWNITQDYFTKSNQFTDTGKGYYRVS